MITRLLRGAWMGALVLLLCAPAWAAAQTLAETPRMRRLGVAEGLPSRMVLALAQKKHILWDVNPHDYKNTAPELMVQTVLQKVRPGSIVLLHDRPNTVAALAGMVEGLRAKGYQLVTVDQLLAQRR